MGTSKASVWQLICDRLWMWSEQICPKHYKPKDRWNGFTFPFLSKMECVDCAENRRREKLKWEDDRKRMIAERIAGIRREFRRQPLMYPTSRREESSMATDKMRNFDEWFGAFDYEGTALSDRAFAEHAWNAGRASVLAEGGELPPLDNNDEDHRIATKEVNSYISLMSWQDLANCLICATSESRSRNRQLRAANAEIAKLRALLESTGELTVPPEQIEELSPMAQMAIARHAARLLAIAKLRADNAKLPDALMVTLPAEWVYELVQPILGRVIAKEET